MTRDFEDVYDLDDMDDDEVRDLIRQKLTESGEVDVARVDVTVEGGHVLLEGRVGTEQEVEFVEHVVTDVLGIPDTTNEIVVDELVRGERSEAADEAAVEDARGEPVLGEGGHRTSDTADHLMANTEHEQFGTADPKESAERGFSYNPPKRPTQEGVRSRETH
jgi:hypothetical protein